MDYKEQIEQAKRSAAKWRKDHQIVGVGELRVDLMVDDLCRSITTLISCAEAAEARVEQAERERDAAIEQLRGECEKCNHYKVTWNGCTPDYECPLSDRCLNRDLWEWNGGQKKK